MPTKRFDSFGVAGIDNINAFVLDRVTAEFRWRPLDREKAPLGLTFMAAPFYGFVDDVSIQQASAFGATLLAIADRELIHEKLYGAVNLLWQFQRAQPYATRILEDASLLGFSSSFSTRIADWLYLGAEASLDLTNFESRMLKVRFAIDL